MRPVFSLSALVLCLVSLPAQALTEWTWHKTPDGLFPSGVEQQQLWLINRARQNPAAEGDWFATSREKDVTVGRDYYRVHKGEMRRAFAALAPKPPAAHDVRLFRAALVHSRDQIARDVQDHHRQVDRADDQGFVWSQFRGNVYSYATNSLMAHAGFNIDWGPGTRHGMQIPAGHRMAIMSVDGDYSNVGIASVVERNARTRVGPLVVTQNFARAMPGTPDHYNRFFVGTVWRDRNRNGRYDNGEGYGGVTVTPSSGTYYAVTSRGGGYAIPITQEGATTLTFSGGTGVPNRSFTVTAGSSSVLVDYEIGGAANQEVQPGPVITLTDGVMDSTRYGYAFGTNQHQQTLTVKFAHPGHDVALTATGYDINRRREVDVYLNGRFRGTLGRSAARRFNTGNRFFLSAAEMSASNTVEFRQRYAGERWGVFRLMLIDTTAGSIGSSAVGAVDSSAYGFRYGSNQNPLSYRSTFTSTGDDLLLSAWGYDIDSSREVEVMLNNRRVGWMRPGANNALQKTSTFLLPATAQQSGSNTIEFRAHGDTWGVQNVRLLPVSGAVVPLTPGVVDSNLYGRTRTAVTHYGLLRTSFAGTGKDFMLSAQGFDVTTATKIGVYLNGLRIGALRNGRANALAPATRLLVPASLQQAGSNTLEFRNMDRPGAIWGVTRIVLQDISGPGVSLVEGTMDQGKYGWFHGNNQHRGIVRATFSGVGHDYEFSATGVDIGSSREVSVWLNSRLVGFMPASPRATASTARFVLSKLLQVNGTNVIEFRSNQPGTRWGIEGLLLRDVSVSDQWLDVDATDYGAYGWGYADSQHRALMRAKFTGTGKPMALQVNGYDITNGREVAVFLNNALLGFLRPGGAMVHGRRTELFVPGGLQYTGTNTIEFRSLNPGGRWGVTALKLVPQ